MMAISATSQNGPQTRQKSPMRPEAHAWAPKALRQALRAAGRPSWAGAVLAEGALRTSGRLNYQRPPMRLPWAAYLCDRTRIDGGHAGTVPAPQGCHKGGVGVVDLLANG